MHEIALCESVIEIIEEEAKRQAFSQVRTVWLELGSLSHAEPDAIRFGFTVVSRNTLAEGAKLEILTVPGAAWCMRCAKTVAISQRYDPCPNCGGYQLHITAGTEMRLKEMEVD
jgi:hydrogenase nickel incorporation protein HypA/HybF